MARMTASAYPATFRVVLRGGLLTSALIVAAYSPVAAQVATALVQGEIVDDTKGVLPGVTVTARNQATGLTRTSVTDDHGRYRITALQPGSYEMVVELTGFAPVKKGVTLTIGQEATLHFQMQIVSMQENVTVTGMSPLIDTTKATLGSTITAKKLDDLPLAGRNYLSLVTLAPGVTPQGGGGAAGMASYGRDSGRIGYQVDGVSQEQNIVPFARGSLSPEAVQEFQILTNQFSAEYGQASGPIVNVLTRSGTNTLHGRAGVFTRSNKLDARPYFAKGEAPFSQQWYSASVGGPMVRDRIHYFGAIERITQDETVVVTSPLMPGEYKRPSRELRGQAKLDIQLGSAHHLTGRYNFNPTKTVNSGVGDLNTIERGVTSKRKRHDVQGTVTTVFSPRVVNELRLQYAGNFGGSAITNCGTCPAITRPSGNLGKATNQPQTFDEQRLQLVNHLSITRGSHNLKFGVNYNYAWDDVYFPSTRDGSFTFTTDRAFDAADPTTYPVQYDIRIGDPGLLLIDNLISGFVQDAWQVRSNLTVNLGLRYDYESIYGARQDKNNFGPRLSVTFDPKGDGNFIIRAGSGIFYDYSRGELALFALQSLQKFTQIRITNPGYPDPFGPNPNGTREGNLPTPTLTVADPAKRMIYSERTSLGFAKALTSTTRLSSDFVWVHGLKLRRNRDINYPDPVTGRRPNPSYGLISQQEGSGQTMYYGLESELEQRLHRSVQFTLAYTLSRTRHDLNVPISQLDYREAMARAGNPHVITASGLYQLPFGFQVGALFRARSGSYWSALTGRDDNRDGFFTDRPAGEGRNTRVGPWLWVVDARVTKVLQVGQGRRLELLAEAFNLKNRPNFDVPENRLTSANFGKFVAMDANYTPRQVQLGLRFSF
jgi:carboxypeptidase family protein/TonB-dependent receptor-like protein